MKERCEGERADGVVESWTAEIRALDGGRAELRARAVASWALEPCGDELVKDSRSW